MEPIIIEDLVDFGYDQGLAEGIERGIERGRVEGIVRGRVEGIERGRAEESARAILAVLEARGVTVGEPFVGRVRGCSDLDTLEAWLRRAATAACAEDVFAEG